MKLVRSSLVLAVVAILASAAHAETVIDLTAVTGGLSSLGTAVLGVCSAVIGGGIALMAVKFGGKWVVRLWKSFTS